MDPCKHQVWVLMPIWKVTFSWLPVKLATNPINRWGKRQILSHIQYVKNSLTINMKHVRENSTQWKFVFVNRIILIRFRNSMENMLSRIQQMRNVKWRFYIFQRTRRAFHACFVLTCFIEHIHWRQTNNSSLWLTGRFQILHRQFPMIK